MADRKFGIETLCLHAGQIPDPATGARAAPIYQTTSFVFDSADHAASLFNLQTFGNVYSRISNPTVAVLEERVAAIENGRAALACATGQAAEATAILTLAKGGDHIVSASTLYGGTHTLLGVNLAKLGIETTFVDSDEPQNFRRAIRPNTRMLYAETLGNPLINIVDIEAVAGIAREAGIPFVVDNTVPSPYLCRPVDWGADIVVHSATKYLGGHGDLLAGIAVTRQALAEAIRLEGLKDMTGAVLSAQDAALVLRGMKTLPLRMDRHCDNAQRLAEMLAEHPAVERVYYPGLANFPQHALAQRQMARPGGMLAFELRGGLRAGIRFLNALQLILRAVSLGDCESLAQHPASMTHSAYTPEERKRHHISEGLVRLSAGLEAFDDLQADILQALAQAQ